MELVHLPDALKGEWSKTRTSLMWTAPAFTHIFFTMLDYRERGNKANAFFTREVPVAATDGWRLLLNPDTFFKYSVAERTFIVCHEIMHCIWSHPMTGDAWRRRGYVVGAKGGHIPYNHDVANIAADLIINDLLAKSKQGSPPKDCLMDQSLGTSTDPWNEVYERVWNKMPKQGGGQGQGSGSGNSPSNAPPGLNGQSGFDRMLDPNGSPGDKPEDKQANGAGGQTDLGWKQAIAAATALGKAQGNMPAELERVFQDMVEPKVDWVGAIQGAVSRRVGSSDSSWRRCDRRLIVRDMYAPGRSSHGCGAIALVGDTSGSMSDAEIGVILRELRGIMEDLNPSKVYVIWCDADVHAVEEIDDASDIPSLRPKGGGGTDFRPPFAWLAEQGIEPDGMIYVTDGYGPFPPQAPEYPVIWADITGPGKISYPWGDVINIPRDDLGE